MPTYKEWNEAISIYFTYGLAGGETIYLSIDKDTLEQIGRLITKDVSNSVNWTEDFLQAVRMTCTRGNTISFSKIEGYDHREIPACVGFLSAMVIAAHQMAAESQGDEVIGENNYFKRFRQIMGLPEETGRPSGMIPPGKEEILWKNWNKWVMSRGLLSSAEQGSSTPSKYINYPLSQALLREGDKERLVGIFKREERGRRLGRTFDREALEPWIKNQQGIFTSHHIRILLDEKDPKRYAAVIEAIHDVYSTISWDDDTERAGIGLRRILAGLYRVEDPITGQLTYKIYPRQYRGWQGGKIVISTGDKQFTLKPDRLGWFMPLWIINPGVTGIYTLSGDPFIKEMVLPNKDFWILIRDPEDKASGTFASWGHPGLGETFILLCKKEYADQMETLKDENLLRWKDMEPVPGTVGDWVEFRECMVLSQNWDGIVPIRDDLFNILRPSISASVQLSEGLKAPQQGGWLEGYPPEIRIGSFDDEAHLKIRDIQDMDDHLFDGDVKTNLPFRCPVSSQGDYLIEVRIENRIAARKTLRIISWNQLNIQNPNEIYSIDLPGYSLQGPLIKRN